MQELGLNRQVSGVIILLLLPFFLATSPKPMPSSTSKSSITLWSEYLPTLNQTPEIGSLISPEGVDLKVDLLALHAKENQKILDAIGKSIDSKIKGKARSRQVNDLYFKKVSELNQQTLAGIDRAAKSHQLLAKNHRALAKDVLAQVHKNSVASLSASVNYDSSGQIGFCFGRALLVHHLLLSGGVPQADIAKIFVFGDLRVQNQFWKFHVAVMVRDATDGFLVVDPLMEEPMPYLAWIDVTKKFEIKGKSSRARFYVTDPRKFLPGFGSYHSDQLEEPLLKKYFDELALSLRRLK